MKHNLLKGFTVSTLFFANISHADFTFHSSMANACQYISGQWAGSGKAYNWIIGDCIYNGSGTVSTADNAGNFIIEVAADKLSGNFVCPGHATSKLIGVCNNGVVTIKTEYGNLEGIFSKNTGDATGKLSVSPGIAVDISIQFQRVK